MAHIEEEPLRLPLRVARLIRMRTSLQKQYRWNDSQFDLWNVIPRWIAVHLFVLFAALLPVTAAAQSWDGQHDPTVRIGGPKLRNILLFAWDHRCAACSAAYRDIIIPLDPDIASGALMVLMVQTLPRPGGDAQVDAINAASLLIAPTMSYPAVTSGWLIDGIAAKSTTLEAMTAAIAQSLRENWSRDPNVLVAALTDKEKLERAMTMLKIWSDKIEKAWPHGSNPLIVLNGRTMAEWGIEHPSSEAIRKLLLTK